jgi:hypothetical protein
MTPDPYSPAAPRSNYESSVGTVIFYMVLWLTVIGGLYFMIPSATTSAEYTVTIGQPMRDDGFKQVVSFERLSSDEQDVFITLYRRGDYGDRHSIFKSVPWNERQSAPYQQFRTINYVQYRDRYYPITTTIEKDHTSYVFFQNIVLGVGGIVTVLLLLVIWDVKS